MNKINLTMPTQIGNTKVYTSEEVARATLFGLQTTQKMLRESVIKSSKTTQGQYQITHNDLVDYLVNEQEIPRDSVDRIIEFRISNNKLTTANK